MFDPRGLDIRRLRKVTQDEIEAFKHRVLIGCFCAVILAIVHWAAHA